MAKQVFADEYFGEHPAFARVKPRNAPPAYSYEIKKYEFGNLKGIPITWEGWIVATARYRVHFLCDVCGEEVHEEEILGHPTDVKRDEALELEKQLAQEIPFRDKDVIENIGKHVFFQRFYLFQCPRCGRWVGKGAKHQHCKDDEYGLCKYCGNTMRKIVEQNIKIVKEGGRN